MERNSEMNRELKKFNHFDLLFPSDYAKAGDLNGRDMAVTITDIEPRHALKTTSGKSEARPLVHFSDGIKPLVLNKTNGKILRKLYGSEVTAWLGKRVTLYSATVDAFGEQVEAIRIRAQVPRGVRAEPTMPLPDHEPAHDEETGEVEATAADVMREAWSCAKGAGKDADWLKACVEAHTSKTASADLTLDEARLVLTAVERAIDAQVSDAGADRMPEVGS
jgi:hypothetical protein